MIFTSLKISVQGYLWNTAGGLIPSMNGTTVSHTQMKCYNNDICIITLINSLYSFDQVLQLD